jgi:hypothetical protein
MRGFPDKEGFPDMARPKRYGSEEESRHADAE